MQYRGFNIFSSVPTVIDRYSTDTHQVEYYLGVYCEVYDKYDDDLAFCLDTFSLAVGYELNDIYTETIEQAMRCHVDEHNIPLNLIRNEAELERKNILLGRVIDRLSEHLDGEELYRTLTEKIGMTDEDIRASNMKNLTMFFDRPAYAQTIADYMIHVGTENTTTGNWHFSFGTISERFGIDLTNDSEMVSLIEEELYKRGDILSQIDIYDNDFDLMFFLDYCPYSDRDEIEDEEQDAKRIGKEEDMALKAQKITAELPTPRYRALHYYLEKEGKSIESELRKHLEQMYREQVPKDVQEYVKAQNPDMEDPEQPAGNIKRQRVGQKHDAVVPAPDAPTLNM